MAYAAMYVATVSLTLLSLIWSESVILPVAGLALSLSNLMGYLRCKMGKTDSVSSVMSGVANQYFQVHNFSV